MHKKRIHATPGTGPGTRDQEGDGKEGEGTANKKTKEKKAKLFGVPTNSTVTLLTRGKPRGERQRRNREAGVSFTQGAKNRLKSIKQQQVDEGKQEGGGTQRERGNWPTSCLGP